MINENDQNYSEEEITETEESVEAENEDGAATSEGEAPSSDQAKSKEASWKELREKAERADKLQRERDEYYNMLKQVEEHYKNASPKEEQFDLDSIDDDDLPDGKTLKKLFRQQQKERQELQSYIKRQQQVQYEYAVKNELTNRFGDFDSVVNEENIIRLREMRPGLARQLHTNPDIKEKAIETYYAIKELGIYENPTDRYERDRIKSNAKKPRSINTVAERGTDPLDYASTFTGDLTPEMKRKLYEDALKKSGRS